MGIINYRVMPVQRGYHVVNLQMHWRKLPYVLDRLRGEEYDIRKANIHTNDATLYIKNKQFITEATCAHHSLSEIIADGYQDLYRKAGDVSLPADTEVLLYNMPRQNKTTLEFSCIDRVGLLSDVLDLLTVFPFELQSSYVSTVGPFAHNLFFLQANKKPLNKEEIEYIQNVFEYEVKKRKSMLEDNQKY